ncbi:Dynein Heavy Chain 9, Axonemal [Manis pentadactyla]|nr:Dynein Heavy Chain 9, Axonemal [Manis pentadactyla]
MKTGSMLTPRTPPIQLLLLVQKLQHGQWERQEWAKGFQQDQRSARGGQFQNPGMTADGFSIGPGHPVDGRMGSGTCRLPPLPPHHLPCTLPSSLHDTRSHCVGPQMQVRDGMYLKS